MKMRSNLGAEVFAQTASSPDEATADSKCVAPSQFLSARNRRRFLKGGMYGRLSPLLREATEIRYSEEVSVSEVAARTRASLVATKSRLLRARKSLIRALSEDGVLHGSVSKLERTHRTWL